MPKSSGRTQSSRIVALLAALAAMLALAGPAAAQGLGPGDLGPDDIQFPRGQPSVPPPGTTSFSGDCAAHGQTLFKDQHITLIPDSLSFTYSGTGTCWGFVNGQSTGARGAPLVYDSEGGVIGSCGENITGSGTIRATFYPNDKRRRATLSGSVTFVSAYPALDVVLKGRKSGEAVADGRIHAPPDWQEKCPSDEGVDSFGLSFFLRTLGTVTSEAW